MKAKELTDKQQMFAKEYLIDLNATQAAIRAGYSEHTAKSQGNRLLTNVDVAEAIQKAMDKRADKVETEADWVLRTIKETTEKLLAEPEKYHTGIYKGCELLGKHQKLFTDKHEHTGKDGGPIEGKWTIEVIKPK
jgi:phage terminase small subunit